MWAATPMLIDFSGSSRGPLVGRRQPGFEQRYPTRFAICSIVVLGKSFSHASMSRDSKERKWCVESIQIMTDSVSGVILVR
jgi:hypothetical protein